MQICLGFSINSRSTAPRPLCYGLHGNMINFENYQQFLCLPQSMILWPPMDEDQFPEQLPICIIVFVFVCIPRGYVSTSGGQGCHNCTGVVERKSTNIFRNESCRGDASLDSKVFGSSRLQPRVSSITRRIDVDRPTGPGWRVGVRHNSCPRRLSNFSQRLGHEPAFGEGLSYR